MQIAKAKLREWRKRQQGFINQTGLKRDYAREQINQIPIAKFKNSGIIKLSINLFDKSDGIYLDAFSVEEEPGFEDVCLHGNPASVQMIVNRKPRIILLQNLQNFSKMKHHIMAETLDWHRALSAKATIRLRNSCQRN